jgi:hypothetical protein
MEDELGTPIQQDAYHLDMSTDDAEKALAEILMVDWKVDGQVEENGAVGRLRRREEDEKVKQWRGRRGRIIFCSGRKWVSVRGDQSGFGSQVGVGTARISCLDRTSRGNWHGSLGIEVSKTIKVKVR